MMLPEPITGQAGEVGVESKAVTLLALQGVIAVMLLSRVLAFTGGPPCVHVEVFAPDQPVHAALLWSRGHKHESLAGALLACGAGLLAEVSVIMFFHVVAAEALGSTAEP